jgi:7-alpha-hydroxysteroid dehydrogenase
MILDRFTMDGQVAIVTGSGEGIGESIAIGFAEAGADVVLTARRREPLERTADTIRDLKRQALVVTGDINHAADMQRVVDEAVNQFGRINVVVTNAGSGGAPGTPFLATTEDHFDSVFHANVTSRFLLSRLAAPHIAASGGGAVIHITSVLGRVRERGFVVTGATNAAVAHMTRNMAADLAPMIRVNAIACGSIGTPTLLGFVTDERLRQALAGATLMRRIGTSEDVAAAALYLASPAGAWVTGKVFEIDGGQEACSLQFGLPDI